MLARTRLLTLSVAITSLLVAPGCIFTSSGSSGNVTFLWSFNGNSCGAVPDVTQVRISIPGETLDNGGLYSCATNGTAGIVLTNFGPGTYNYTITAENSSSAVLWQSTGSFRVNGNVTVNVTFSPNSSAPGAAYITWAFPPSSVSGGAAAACAQTSGPISGVTVTLDNDTAHPVEFNCTDGQSTSGALISNLAAGSHSIDLAAHDSSGLYYYRKTSTLPITAGTSSSYAYTLDWFVGSLPIKYTFSNGVTQLTCAQAGVTQLTLNLIDTQSQAWFGSSGKTIPCSDTGFIVDYVYGGNYSISLAGYGTGNVLYKSNMTTPPVGTATAGVFPNNTSGVSTIVLGL